MRKSGGLVIPFTLIVLYYGFWIGLTTFLLSRYPSLRDYIPIGGIGDLAAANVDTFEPIYSHAEESILAPHGPIRLALASIGALILTVPVSWVYFITSKARRIDQSFLQTIMILPVVVTGIAMIVLNSLALAFSLAGVVAANCDRPGLRYRCARCCGRHILCIRVRYAVYLEARIRQDAIRSVPDDDDPTKCR